jgi:hypothetical protein
MRSTIFILAVILAGAMCSPRLLYGQSFGGPSTGSPFGSSPFGNSMGGNPFGNSMSNNPFGSNAGTGNSRFGTTPQMGEGFSPLPTFSSSSSNTARNNMNTNSPFGPMPQPQFNQPRNNSPFNRGNRPTNNPQTASRVSTIRTNYAADLGTPIRKSSQVSSTLATRLKNLPAIHWNSSPQVEVQGRTVILRGEVASEHDRDLAERVTYLEAGVDRVENQLRIAANSPEPSAE